MRTPIPVEHAKIKPKKGGRTCNIERDNGCLLTASCKWQKQKRKFPRCRRSRATGKSNVQEHQFPLSMHNQTQELAHQLAALKEMKQGTKTEDWKNSHCRRNSNRESNMQEEPQFLLCICKIKLNKVDRT